MHTHPSPVAEVHEAGLSRADHALGFADAHAPPAFLLNGKLVDVSFGFEKLEETVHAPRSPHA